MTRAMHFFGAFLVEAAAFVVLTLLEVAALAVLGLLLIVTSPIWGPVALWMRWRGQWVAAALCVALAGCGASTLDRTERAYGVAHAAQAETVARFEARIRERVRERCPTGEDACALEVAAEHRAAAAGLALSADALDAAGRELVRWAASHEKEMPPSVCRLIADALTAVGNTMGLVTALGTDLSALGLPAWECPEVE